MNVNKMEKRGLVWLQLCLVATVYILDKLKLNESYLSNDEALYSWHFLYPNGPTKSDI